MRKAPVPWASIEPEPSICSALRALRAGTAEPDQQIKAIEFIVDVVCERNGMSYRPGSDRDTAFAEGKRYVGNQIVRLANLIPQPKD